MDNIYLDSETCGLVGQMVLLQWARNDGPIVLHEVWREPIHKTMELIESFLPHNIVCFNTTFDGFMICKIYNLFRTTILHEGEAAKDWLPEDHIETIASYEKESRDGVCLKPASTSDIMLWARKTEFQMTMERKDIRIKKVPTVLADKLCNYLNDNLELPGILFARKKNKFAPRFNIRDVYNEKGELDPYFKNILLKFAPSAGLKTLAATVLGKQNILMFKDIEVEKAFWPTENKYAPFWESLSPIARRNAWPAMIKYHIAHWAFHEGARKYASDDIVYTRDLYKYFAKRIGNIDNDDDSVLAWQVSQCRWKGYAVDLEGISQLKLEIKKLLANEAIPTAPRAVKIFLGQEMSVDERTILDIRGTKKVVLEEISAWFNETDDTEAIKTVHPAAIRAQLVISKRLAKKEEELYDKLLTAERLHADFNITGTLSNRMSGAGALNPQGIKKTKKVRSKFPLAFRNATDKCLDRKLCGGDFAGFEVVLADAAYNDSLLRKDLLTCETCYLKLNKPFVVKFEYEENGKLKKKCPNCGGNKTLKIHALFGTFVYPGYDYKAIKDTDGTANDLYTRAKSAVFAKIYGGEAYTLMTRLGVSQEAAEAANEKFENKYTGVRRARRNIQEKFGSMQQPGGIGTKIVWKDPADHMSSLLGFKRYFTIENMITKYLFELAQKCHNSNIFNLTDKEKRKLNSARVRRRDRLQSPTGAVSSALYAAAFGIQSSNMRAASNHEIQSAGGQATKRVQRCIWDLQPIGVHDYYVMPMNIHDELMNPTHPDYIERVERVVYTTVNNYRDRVPLLEIEWNNDIADWSGKKK